MPAHILVVEDSDLVTGALRMLLEGHGFRVSIAASAALAVEIAERDTVDLLLLDLSLPDADGSTVLDRLRLSGHTPRASIALTGDDDATTHARAMAAGCRDVWLKPVPTRELIERIQRIVD